MSLTIRTLTADMSAGNAEAIEAFYRRYFPLLYAHVRRATDRDENFCLDVVQESVLRIVRTVRPADTEAQFTAWLKLVVRTTAYDLLRSESRRRKREQLVAIASSELRDAGPSDCDEDDRLQWLAKQIASMDRRLVELIDMRFNRRWTLSQIAETLGLSIGTIDGRLRRALADLRDRAKDMSDE